MRIREKKKKLAQNRKPTPCPSPPLLDGVAASEVYGSRLLVSSGDQDDGVEVLNQRDYFDHHTLPLSRRNPNRWPDFPSDYLKTVTRYRDEMKVLTQKLVALISESVGLRASCIDDCAGEFYQNIARSYYPHSPEPELTLGLQSHSDMGAITLLIQDDVGSLQVLKNGGK